MAPEVYHTHRPRCARAVGLHSSVWQQLYSSPADTRIIAGALLAGVGSAGLGTGFGLYVRSRGQRADAQDAELGSPEQQELQRKYDDFRLVPLVGVAGSALLTAAVPMLLPQHGPRSAAGWVGGALAGVAGLAAIAFGAVEARKEPVLGGLLISVGAPLIAIPLTQLVRGAR